MSSTYPQAIDQFTPKVDGVDTVSAAHFNLLQEAVQALQETLGTNPAPGSTAVGAALAARLPKSGGTMTGVLDMGGQPIKNLAWPQEPSDAATAGFVERSVSPERLRWRDDFLGGRSSRWTLAGAGATYLQNSEVGGTGDLSTGTTSANSAFLSFNGKGCTSKAQAPSLRVRAKLGSTTQVNSMLAGLFHDAGNLVEIFYDTTTLASNFKYRCLSSGSATVANSGLAGDTAFHDFAVEVDGATGHVRFRIDGAHEAVLSTNVPTALLEPRLGLETREAADKRLTVDLVHLESGR